MQVCTWSRQITTSAPHSHYQFLQAGCPYRRPTNSVKALKANRNIVFVSLSCGPHSTVECPSICLSVLRRSTAATGTGGFAAEAGRGSSCQSVAAAAARGHAGRVNFGPTVRRSGVGLFRNFLLCPGTGSAVMDCLVRRRRCAQHM